MSRPAGDHGITREECEGMVKGGTDLHRADCQSPDGPLGKLALQVGTINTTIKVWGSVAALAFLLNAAVMGWLGYFRSTPRVSQSTHAALIGHAQAETGR